MRIPRSIQLSDGDVIHLMFRCTDHRSLFLLRPEAIKEFYLHLLFTHKERYKIGLIDFALMDNHVHLVLKISTVKALGRFLQHVHTAFARRVNARFQRSGAVVENRCKVGVVQDDRGLLRLQCYVDLNRWNCKKKVRPEDYKFCGYRHYAGIQKDPRLDEPPAYRDLGNTDEERAAAYRALVEEVRQQGRPAEREALEMCAPYIGSEEFVAEKTAWLTAAIKAHRAHLRTTRIQRDGKDPVLAEALRDKN